MAVGPNTGTLLNTQKLFKKDTKSHKYGGKNGKPW